MYPIHKRASFCTASLMHTLLIKLDCCALKQVVHAWAKLVLASTSANGSPSAESDLSVADRILHMWHTCVHTDEYVVKRSSSTREFVCCGSHTTVVTVSVAAVCLSSSLSASWSQRVQVHCASNRKPQA